MFDSHDPSNVSPYATENHERVPLQIVSFASLEGENVKDDTFIWLNRESSDKQENNHFPKMTELETAKQGLLGTDAPFWYNPITESGMLNGALLKAPCSYPPYFSWLRGRIQDGLRNTPHGKMLRVVFYSVDRLMRPERFDVKDAATWDYSQGDYDIFSDWLGRCFGKRLQDIVFVVLHDGTPKTIRGKQSKAGMVQKGNMGGRSKNIKPITKEVLEEELKSLAPAFGNNATRVFQYLEAQYGQLPIKIRTAQHWLQEAGLSRKPGRPHGTKKNQK